MSKPTLKPGPIVSPPALRPGWRPGNGAPGACAGIIDDPIALMIKAVTDAHMEAIKVNTAKAWSSLDELVGELKHLTHLKFLDARQAAGKPS